MRLFYLVKKPPSLWKNMLMRLGLFLVLPLRVAGADHGHAQHAKLGRGINLGNTLEGPHEGAWVGNSRRRIYRESKTPVSTR